MNFLDRVKAKSEKPWFYPLALLFIGFVTYGYVITHLGYYWADWEIVMFTKLDPSLQFGYYAHDRPFPWTYQLLYFFIGSHPLGWHIVTLLIRWVGTLLLVNSLILIWPRYKKHFFWFGALLLVYPGFLQQTQSATKARHIMTFMLFALSIYLMVVAFRRFKLSKILFPLSWIVTLLHLFTTEYFSSLELIRPILIWILVAENEKDKPNVLRKTLLKSAPYLIILVFFFFCRFVYFPQIFQTTNRLGDINSSISGFHEASLAFLLELFNRVLLDLLYSTLNVWTTAILNFTDFAFNRMIAWLAFGLGIFLTVVFSIFFNMEKEEPDSPSSLSMFLVGFGSFVLSAIPIWAIGKDVSTGGWNDRFALAPMFGAVLMVIALLLLFVHSARHHLVLGFLLVFSIATQVWVVNVYRRDWITQKDYYWQLYWRMPELKPGTAIVSYEQPSLFVTQSSDAGYAINVLYQYKTDDGILPYWFIVPEFQFYFQPDVDIRRQVRNLEFQGNTSDMVVVFHQTEDSCLRVLDTVYKDDPLLTDAHDALVPLSNVSRIVPDSSSISPDVEIFGSELVHTWCYFFQKADLARQVSDWDTVIELHNEAQQLGFSPDYGPEYTPFIEAYAQTGDWQKAYDLTIKARRQTLSALKMFCSTWTRFGEMPSADMKFVQQIHQEFSC